MCALFVISYNAKWNENQNQNQNIGCKHATLENYWNEGRNKKPAET